MEKLFDLIYAILEQKTGNTIRVSIHRNARGYTEIVISDDLSEIGSVYEFFLEKALHEALGQVESFVEELE